MTKKAKVLILILCLSLLLIIYLILTSESTLTKSLPAETANKAADSGALAATYRQQIAPIFKSYLELEKGDYTVDQVTQLKNQLLDLRVPTEYKNLHINLVLALTKMENYLTSGDKAEKVASQQIISQAQADYDWLDN